MAVSLDTIADAVLAHLRDEIPFEVVEHAIPDSETVLRDKTTGKIKPYIAVQFGDIIQQGSRSFNGPRGDDYTLPIYIQVIAPEPSDTRRGASKVTDVFLGEGFTWAGLVRKRLGGAMFPMEGTNAGTEAYIAPLSFGLLIQIDANS